MKDSFLECERVMILPSAMELIIRHLLINLTQRLGIHTHF